MASKGELDLCVESLENWALFSAGVLILGLFGELIEPAVQPWLSHPWASFWWAFCNAMVLAGVGGEVVFGRMGSNRQKELTRRAELELQTFRVSAALTFQSAGGL